MPYVCCVVYTRISPRAARLVCDDSPGSRKLRMGHGHIPVRDTCDKSRSCPPLPISSGPKVRRCNPIQLPSSVSTNSPCHRALRVRQHPRTYLFHRSGRVRARLYGLSGVQVLTFCDHSVEWPKLRDIIKYKINQVILRASAVQGTTASSGLARILPHSLPMLRIRNYRPSMFHHSLRAHRRTEA